MGLVTVFTFTSDTETVTRTKLNNLVANLVTEFNGSISSDNLANDAVTTSKIIVQAVTLPKLENGTQGDVLYYGVGGTATRLGAGTSTTMFLRTGGTGANPAWSLLTGTEIGSLLTGGDGVDITSGTVSVDLAATNPGLEFSTGELQTFVDDSTIERAAGGIQVKADGINDTHIDFGTGANQVSSDDVPEGSTNLYSHGWTLLNAYTPAAVANLDIVSQITSTYDEYKIVFTDVIPAAAAFFMLRVSEDNGSTFKSGATDYFFGLKQIGGDATSGASTFLALTDHTGANTVSTNGISGTVELYNPLGTSVKQSIQYKTGYTTGATTSWVSTGNGQYNSTNAVDAIQFLFNGQNITSGTFKIYGLIKS